MSMLIVHHYRFDSLQNQWQGCSCYHSHRFSRHHIVGVFDRFSGQGTELYVAQCPLRSLRIKEIVQTNLKPTFSWTLERHDLMFVHAKMAALANTHFGHWTRPKVKGL